jgi:hypothetical protein
MGEIRSMMRAGHVGRIVGDLHAQLLIGEQRASGPRSGTAVGLVG